MINSLADVNEYRALTIRNPYAWLIAQGEKDYETRGWKTDYRGPLAIHAGKYKPTRSDVVHMKNTLYQVMDRHHVDSQGDMAYGAVLCIVNLVDCISTGDTMPDTWEQLPGMTQQEFVFGDYSPGRWAWKLELLEVFAKPVPATGKLGLWRWERST